MDINRTKELIAKKEYEIDVMRKAIDNRIIQCSAKGKSTWYTCEVPLHWDWENFDYRIKPNIEVGKWYKASGYSFKCIANEMNKYIFIYEDGLIFSYPEDSNSLRGFIEYKN